MSEMLPKCEGFPFLPVTNKNISDTCAIQIEHYTFPGILNRVLVGYTLRVRSSSFYLIATSRCLAQTSHGGCLCSQGTEISFISGGYKGIRLPLKEKSE